MFKIEGAYNGEEGFEVSIYDSSRAFLDLPSAQNMPAMLCCSTLAS